MVDRWALGWSRQDWADLREGGSLTWIHPPAGHFYADPFLTLREGEPWVFFEDYVEGRGHIACCPLQDPGAVEIALKMPFHLSYPNLVEWQGELFCVPEQYEAGKVSLYRCVDFPGGWVEEKVLLEDFPGVDPNLFWHRGHWYLWVGNQSNEPRHKVFLYCSQSLTGKFSAHPQTPLIKWGWTGRNGGRIVSYQGRLLRPAQNRTRTYGGGLVLYEICDLSPRGYLEREWGRWEPDPSWPYPDGLHHVCTQDGWTVIDAKLFVEGL